jgi:5-amino-6-(5-phosphoribosylamino)uracil reductase
MEFRQLLPEPGAFDVNERLEQLDLGGHAPAERPYTVVNFVASADGRATFAGKSGQLGDDGDRAMFHGLREHVDAVLAGTRTMALEHYGRILGSEERRERRLKRGLPPEPLACVVSRTGAVPSEIPLFDEPEARVVVFCPNTSVPELHGCPAHVELVELDPAEVTLTTALRRLRSDYGVCSLLCEGGPTMFGAMLHERVADELFLTIAPELTGGGAGPTITSGPELLELTQLELVWALERAGSLFLRYKIDTPSTA